MKGLSLKKSNLLKNLRTILIVLGVFIILFAISFFFTSKLLPELRLVTGSDYQNKGSNVSFLIENLTKDEFSELPYFVKEMPLNVQPIDSNGDGVRDDIEKFIAYKFPFSPHQRAAYQQVVRNLDKVATDAGQRTGADQIQLWVEESNALVCFYSNNFDDEDFLEIKALTLNKPKLLDAYKESQRKRGSIDLRLLSKLDFANEACDQNLVENQIFLQQWKAE
ncbi:hypothetical protein C9980_13795 [Vibrio mediterranei]|uniref:hypothetical protein n=1 Tax=Vibrio mediterranei TaxID=689 RepID=UPI000D184822|nr:hypothetical protein [Vibrio mediterranei]PTC04297.1 hypothetical protein C9980_13795 [Vibrio mediterranei]